MDHALLRKRCPHPKSSRLVSIDAATASIPYSIPEKRVGARAKHRNRAINTYLPLTRHSRE